jgi:hypothetical protein
MEYIWLIIALLAILLALIELRETFLTSRNIQHYRVSPDQWSRIKAIVEEEKEQQQEEVD